MFKAVAEYAMRGRMQAIVVALVGSWLPFISQAAFGLVTLRKGWQEGLLVTLWASLPAFIGIWMAKEATAIVEASLVVYLLGFVACWVLRATVSWPVTLLLSVVLASLASLVIVATSETVVTDVSAFFERAVQTQGGAQSERAVVLLESWNVNSVSGLISVWISVTTIVGALIARWWQALLYNPGGFREEFHALRIDPTLAIICAIALVVCLSSGDSFVFWAAQAGIPLLFGGLGLAHWLLKRFGLNTPFVAAMYVMLVLFPFGTAILMALAMADAMLDIRNRLKIDPPEPG